MVVVSEYSSNPPTAPGRVKIAGGPLYDLTRVQALVVEETKVFLWTRECIKKVGNLYETVREQFGSQLEMVADMVLALQQQGRYIDSEWCENGGGAIAACDAYELTRREFIPVTGKEMVIKYFVKFAIGKTGNVVLMVSCHV